MLTSDQNVTSALVNSSGNPVAWQNTDTLIIPSSFAGLPIAIQDSGGNLTAIAADEIEVQAPGVTLEGLTTSDVLAIDPNNATDLVADTSSDGLTISAPIVPLATGMTVVNTAGNFGTFVIDGTASVDTINATAGVVVFDSSAVVSASTSTASAGTFRLDGTLNLADNGGGVTISGSAALAGGGTIALGMNTTLTYHYSANLSSSYRREFLSA